MHDNSPAWRSSDLSVSYSLAVVFLCLEASIGVGSVRAQQGATLKPVVQVTALDRQDDRKAIQAALQSFVKAFESRDAEALAAHWTAEGEYESDGEPAVRGRETIQKRFSEFFAKTPELKAEVRSDSLRFLSSDTAINEGLVSIRRGAAATATKARYKILVVREKGRWLFAQLNESPKQGVAVSDIAWLIGEWKSTIGQDAEIRTVYSWSPSKKFIHSEVHIKEKALAFTVNQVIGVDPATGAIHTWSFEADGGVGEADWSSDGDHWILNMEGTLVDGTTLTETNILRRVDDDTFTWQSINRMFDGAELADLAPVKVKRVKTGQ